MRISFPVLAGVLIGLAAQVQAATFFSPPMNVNSSELDLVCSIVNVSSSAKTVRIQIFNDNGQPSFDSGSRVVGPGSATTAQLPSGVATTIVQYCRFDADGRKAGYRPLAALRRRTDDEDVVVVVPQ